MHGTRERSNLAPVFATSDASTGQCLRGADNGRAGARRGTPGLIGLPKISTAGPWTSPPGVFSTSTGSIWQAPWAPKWIPHRRTERASVA